MNGQIQLTQNLFENEKRQTDQKKHTHSSYGHKKRHTNRKQNRKKNKLQK